jgi:hypothetical protein
MAICTWVAFKVDFLKGTQDIINTKTDIHEGVKWRSARAIIETLLTDSIKLAVYGSINISKQYRTYNSSSWH